MKINNLIFLFLFVNEVFCYNFGIIHNLLTNKNKLKLNRRSTIFLLPIIYHPLKVHAEKEKSVEELREEANRIIEIIEAQKESFKKLPELKKKNEKTTLESNNKIIDLYKNEDVETTLKYILNIFQNSKTDPINALNKLKDISTDSNMVKNTDTKKLLNLFNDSKYGLLLGNFINYEILNYNKYNIDDLEFCDVDVIIRAKYNTLLQNSVQFKDIHYPKEDDDKDLLCYVIYRWNFIKQKNNKFKLESCFLVPNIS